MSLKKLELNVGMIPKYLNYRLSPSIFPKHIVLIAMFLRKSVKFNDISQGVNISAGKGDFFEKIQKFAEKVF